MSKISGDRYLGELLTIQRLGIALLLIYSIESPAADALLVWATAEADEVRLRELCTELLGPARSSGAAPRSDGAASAPLDASAPEASLGAQWSSQAMLPAVTSNLRCQAMPGPY